jgi:hypothetical protein
MSCAALQRLWADVWILERFAGKQGMTRRGVGDKVRRETSLHDSFYFPLFTVQPAIHLLRSGPPATTLSMVLHHAPASNGPNLDDELLLMMMTQSLLLLAPPLSPLPLRFVLTSLLSQPHLTPLTIAPPS